jgi:hypothetical protein
MLDVRIHDKYQIEFKTHYRFKRQEEHTEYAKCSAVLSGRQ